MQNDMLKNNIAPWQEKGRWYHGAWDCSAHAFITNETDAYLLTLGTTVTNNAYYLVSESGKRAIIDSVIIPREDLTVPQVISIFKYRYTSAGAMASPIAPDGTGIIDTYFFITDIK